MPYMKNDWPVNERRQTEYLGDTLVVVRLSDMTFIGTADHEGLVVATAVSHHPDNVRAMLRAKIRKSRKP